MVKKIVFAILSILLTGVIAFCCGYPTTVLAQMFTQIVAVVLFYAILTDVFVTKWGTLKEQKWYYWTAIGLAVLGIIVAFIATRFSSRLWTWIGYIVILVGGGLYGLLSSKAKQN